MFWNMSSSFSRSLCDPEKQKDPQFFTIPHRKSYAFGRRLPESPRRSRRDRVLADTEARAARPTSACTRVWCTWPGARSARSPPRRCSDRWCTRLSSPLSRQGWQQSPQSSLGLKRRNRLYWCMTRVHKYTTDLAGGFALPYRVYPLSFKKDGEKVTVSV